MQMKIQAKSFFLKTLFLPAVDHIYGHCPVGKESKGKIGLLGSVEIELYRETQTLRAVIKIILKWKHLSYRRFRKKKDLI